MHIIGVSPPLGAGPGLCPEGRFLFFAQTAVAFALSLLGNGAALPGKECSRTVQGFRKVQTLAGDHCGFPHVLVSYGCCNQLPQTWWLNLHKCLTSQLVLSDTNPT